MTMVHNHGTSVSTHEVGECHYTVSRSNHGRPVGGRDVHAAVECAFSVERIDALAEGTGYRTFHRPQIRGGVGAHPVGGGHVFVKSKTDTHSCGASQGGILQRVQLVQRGGNFRVLQITGSTVDQDRL